MVTARSAKHKCRAKCLTIAKTWRAQAKPRASYSATLTSRAGCERLTNRPRWARRGEHWRDARGTRCPGDTLRASAKGRLSLNGVCDGIDIHGRGRNAGRIAGRFLREIWPVRPSRERSRIVRQHGATIVEPIDAELDLVVMGEADFPLELGTGASGPFAADVQAGIEAGRITTITETQLWQRLGFVEGEQNIHWLYTPAMLADLLGVPLAIIRRWHRRGLIVSAWQVRRLPYFDFAEVATARRLAELLHGVTPAAIEKKLGAWRRHLPAVERPLAQLSIIVQGRDLLLRQGEGLIEPGGQLRIDFEALTAAAGAADESDSTTATLDRAEPADVAMPDALIKGAEDLEDEGDLEAATESHQRGACGRWTKRRGLPAVGGVVVSSGRFDRRARTLLRGARNRRRLRRGPGESGVRSRRAWAIRAGDRGVPWRAGIAC